LLPRYSYEYGIQQYALLYFITLQASLELNRLAEAANFPLTSFAPLSHALCRLAPSESRATAAYAARAIKLLALEDTLRPVMAGSGLPAALIAALRRWGEEPPCLREVRNELRSVVVVLRSSDTGSDGAQELTQ
jgi:hypothetical protein